ncbi:hypothetical protein [Bacteroides sp. 224]|uniref:hypothetical protein n=1 Tax=Bacteroides sp. 224 TaxID=2302936 RepID=UPI0013D8B975|nr:hypothetical protein [Bacteroides sp. 224]
MKVNIDLKEMCDTIFINQEWNISELKLGHSNLKDFSFFKENKNLGILKKEQNDAHADRDTGSCWHSNITFKNDSTGLLFRFSSQWLEGDPPIEYVLEEVIFENYQKIQFYNGITSQSRLNEFVDKFGKPNKHVKEFSYAKKMNSKSIKIESINYQFDNIIVWFFFKDSHFWFTNIRVLK